uniref:Uncharacterized protein n=1 Tax=Nymphaea colorata TaxID=210225 RepID=A0A5K1BA90_9MAGN
MAAFVHNLWYALNNAKGDGVMNNSLKLKNLNVEPLW